METFGKIAGFFCFFVAVIFSGCQTVKQAEEDVLVIAEIMPLPKDVQEKKRVQYEPVYGVMRVLEITQKNGVQVELMAKAGDVKTGLNKGVSGEISATADFGEIIGTFKILSVMNGFVTCRIESVTKKIPANAYIRVQTGQKEKEE